MSIYLLAKKIHRLAIWSTTISGMLQGFTGLNLKYGWFNSQVLFNLHLQNGVIFVITFAVSMLTGLVMYTVLLPKKTPTVSL